MIMRTLFVVLICIAFATISVSIIEAETIRVPEDFPKISMAIVLAADGGDTILVGPGVYEEKSIYIIPRLERKFGAITLQGAGAQKTTVIGGIDIQAGSEIVKKPFKIDGFRIEGGISTHGVSIIISHNTIIGGIGLEYKSPHKIIVEENVIKDASTAIRCEGNDSRDKVEKADVLILNNVIENNRTGISCRNTSPQIRGNRIIDNERGIDIRVSLDYIAQPDLGTRRDPGRNTIYKNTDYDIKNVTDEIISAEYNYWGHPGGPKKGGVILINLRNGWIDYEPWLFGDEAAYSVQPERKLPSTWGQIKVGRW